MYCLRRRSRAGRDSCRPSPREPVHPALDWDYDISWQVSVSEAGHLVLGLDNAGGGRVIEQPSTVVGRATRTSEIANRILLATSTVNSILTVRNPTGNTPALTVTPNAGGTHAVSASLVIVQIQ